MKATIDRIEGSLAVLVSRDDETVRVTLPVSVLPRSREGDILPVTPERDEKVTDEARSETASLIGRLKRS